MKTLVKVLVLLYTFGMFFAISLAKPVHAIVVVVPLIFGLPVVLGWVIAIASLPVTIISIFVNVDTYKTSKKKFFLFTLVTWLIMLVVIGAITALVFYLRQ